MPPYALPSIKFSQNYLKLQDIYILMEQEWFAHPEWWFNSSPNIDAYLTTKYEYLLDQETFTSPVEMILVYDQLPRHIFRNQQASHIISFFLQKALKVTVDLDALSNDEFCFALLPQRHTNDPQMIYNVMLLTWQRIFKNQSSTLTRFLRATYLKCPHVGATHVTQSTLSFNQKILFNNPQQPPKVPCYSFLPAFSNSSNKQVVVSLSGGVDSMVSCWVLSQYYKVKAIHINYNNRQTSNDEEEFVKHWCWQNNIELYTRKIHEIQREPCMKYGLRDTYESYTRNIRYHCYKQFGTNAIVVLGHNKDDILENIFTNIAHKTKYENLNGMVEFSCQDNITFWRPLLQKTKREITIFANQHNIPYLPNSTPEWSQRGQIRASIVPTLNKWNPNFTDSMYFLSHIMNDLYSSLDVLVNSIHEKAIVTTNSITVICDILHTSPVFWRTFFTKFQMTPSMKSIKNMNDRIFTWDYNNISKLRINLQKDVEVTISKHHNKFHLVISKRPRTATIAQTPATDA
jgi:tRNA(Ile)-lysidine synthetase-like protein